RTRHREIVRGDRGQGTGESLLDTAGRLRLRAWDVRGRQTGQNRQKKAPQTDVTHCSFDPRAAVSGLKQKKARHYARTYRGYHFMHPVRLGTRPAGTFTRQPLIVAYLIAGFFIGPFGMGWVKSQESSGNRS